MSDGWRDAMMLLGVELSSTGSQLGEVSKGRLVVEVDSAIPAADYASSVTD